MSTRFIAVHRALTEARAAIFSQVPKGDAQSNALRSLDIVTWNALYYAFEVEPRIAREKAKAAR